MQKVKEQRSDYLPTRATTLGSFFAFAATSLSPLLSHSSLSSLLSHSFSLIPPLLSSSCVTKSNKERKSQQNTNTQKHEQKTIDNINTRPDSTRNQTRHTEHEPKDYSQQQHTRVDSISIEDYTQHLSTLPARYCRKK